MLLSYSFSSRSICSADSADCCSGSALEKILPGGGIEHLDHKYPNKQHDDYGFFEELDHDAANDLSVAIELTEVEPRQKVVICEVIDAKAPVSLRAFNTGSHSSSKWYRFCASISTSICVEGFRIILDNRHGEEDVEYKVRLSIDGRDFIGWKRYDDFRDLVAACTHYVHSKPRPHNHHHNSNSGDDNNPQLRSPGCPPGTQFTGSGVFICRGSLLRESLKAWRELENNQPFSWLPLPSSLSRSITRSRTDIKQIFSDVVLLKRFLRNLLFEVPCIDLLVEFMAPLSLSHTNSQSVYHHVPQSSV